MLENHGLSRPLPQTLLQRLQEAGSGHLFGGIGEDALDFIDAVIASPIEWVGTCNGLHTGYAAADYVRLNGAEAAVGKQR